MHATRVGNITLPGIQLAKEYLMDRIKFRISDN